MHNSALIAIYDKLSHLQNDVNEIRASLTKRIDDVNVKIDNWSARVEDLERRCEVCSYHALPFVYLFSILTLLSFAVIR